MILISWRDSVQSAIFIPLLGFETLGNVDFPVDFLQLDG